MTSSSDILLYWSDGSAPCMSVLITLEEKSLHGYRHKCLSFDRQEHKNSEVLELNPRGQLPTCQIGDIVLSESLAICKYLDEKHPTKGVQLSPNDKEENALMWQKLCEFYWNFPRKCYKNYVRYFWDIDPSQRNDIEINRLRNEFISEIKLWEAYLKETSKDGVYIMGSRFTLADVIIFPYIAYMVALSLDLEASNLTHLNNYYKTLKLRPSIANTFPKYWDGSQDTTVLKDIHKYFGKY